MTDLRRDPSHPFRRRPASPARLIAGSFAVAILVGTVLLALPAAHAPGVEVSLLDALFTATSAVCVTGLIVLDTGTDFSMFGQVVILLLIQLGGLGILSAGTLLALAAGRRIGYRERQQLQSQLNTLQVGGVVRLLRAIAILVVAVETVGALLLWAPLAAREGLGRGAYLAVFHAISAFNNAGFSPYAGSLMGYVTDPVVNLVVMTLIVVGGLGFVVISNVIARVRLGRTARMSLHARIVLASTAALLVGATAVVLALEWGNPATLGALSPVQRPLAALFQAVTPRTAGFNTLDTAALLPGTLLFVMLLMFVGGSPGSTAGGIKTVGFVLLMGSAWSQIRGRNELVLFGRRVPSSTAVRAGAIALSAMLLLGAATTVLLITEPNASFQSLAFEAVSAFGTVGLSTGVTPTLSEAGRVVVILLMYLGRLGPMTLGLALVGEPHERKLTYPEEEVVIG
ncbi:MAG: TrkH family potassium uptake protein [Trueperaceae bacterium]